MDTPDSKYWSQGSDSALQDLKQNLLQDFNFQSHQIEENVSLIGRTCKVCLENAIDLTTLPQCEHEFCFQCIKFYLQSKILQGQTQQILCLNSNCSNQLQPQFFYSFLDTHTKEKYQKFHNEYQLEIKGKVLWCPKPDCRGFSNQEVNCICNQCGFNFCQFCRHSFHGRSACPEQDKDFLRYLIKNKVKFCPQCRRKVEKDGGCLHMICIRCGFQWCWSCGRGCERNHNKFVCYIGKSYFDLYWYVIFILLLMPLILPFGIFVWVVLVDILNQDWFDQIQNGVGKAMMKRRWLMYILIFVSCPVVECFLVFLGGIFLSFVLVTEFVGFFWKRWWTCSLNIVLGLVLGGFMVGVILVAVVFVIVLGPVLGIIQVVSKFVGLFLKKENPYYPRPVILN